MPHNERRLMIFGMTRLSDMLRKGNVWYVTHYREAFDRVDCVYLVGESPQVPPRRETHLVSAGSRRLVPSLLLAPLRLWRQVRERKPTHYLTADILTSWWTAILPRVVLRARIVVMPVCTPGEIYRNTGSTFSGLPKKIEDALIWLSFSCADRLLVAANSPATRRWLEGSAFAHKVIVARATPEELPSIDFLVRIPSQPRQERSGQRLRLVYVGRLEPEKHVKSLVDVAAALERASLDFELCLVGGGSIESEMRRRAEALGVAHTIRFLGYQSAGGVADQLAASDIFLSTLTGTALKEAALAGLPVVAYDIDYVPDLLTHELDAMLVPVDNAEQMAAAVLRIATEPELRRRIADELRRMASERWSVSAVRAGLEQAFPRGSECPSST
jgi:glycosyltransferase involved in cell wall biosynthesis